MKMLKCSQKYFPLVSSDFRRSQALNDFVASLQLLMRAIVIAFVLQ